MRSLLLIVTSIIIFQLAVMGQVKVGIITDIHYLSSELMDGKYAIQNTIEKGGRNFSAVPEILDQVLTEYIDERVEVLLICGDLTKDGEKSSHIELRDKLERLRSQGCKVFVIPGNHDINMPNSIGFIGNNTYKAENISPKEFSTIYENFGYGDALCRDKYSLSYIAELDKDTWLLAIDAARYDEYRDKQITAGRIKSQTKTWIKDMLEDAQSKQKRVLAMMHWGVVEHLPMQSVFFGNYLVEDYDYDASFLADLGVKVIFTGHFHSNDVSVHQSEDGNAIYDVETGTLASYPFSYRLAELHKDRINIRTKNITTIKSDTNLVFTNKNTMKRIASTMAIPMLRNKKLNIPEAYIEPLSQIAGELFILHLAGDEKLDNKLKTRLIKTLNTMEIPIDEDFNLLELDLPPNDNNLTIYF